MSSGPGNILLLDLKDVFVEDFIYQWTSQNLPVLVHCRAGVSRSASVVLAYMVRFGNFTLNDAFVYLRAARPAVTPNLGFMEKLVAYEDGHSRKTLKCTV